MIRSKFYSNVGNFQGNGFLEDSFCLSIAEASRLLGHSVGYEQILSVTTNAFAPGFDTGNSCKELWVANAWVNHHGIPETGMKELGFRIEPILIPKALLSEPSTTEYIEAMLRQIRAAISEGYVVITSGGWKHKSGQKEDWVEPWWAGIVLSVLDDGAVLGAHLNGRKDCVLSNIISGEIFVVSLLKEPVKTRDTSSIILESAINRILGRGKTGAFSRDKFCSFGVDAMDDWFVQMSEILHFCPDCHQNKGASWKSAEVVAQVVMRRSKVAANWLKERSKEEFSKQKYLEDAAYCYDRIVGLLSSAIENNGYKEIIGDLEKQKEHAEKVLKLVKEELIKASESMQKALKEN